jgi:hypothetical protein
MAGHNAVARTAASIWAVVLVGARHCRSNYDRLHFDPNARSYGEGGMAILVVGLFIGGIACIGSLVLALIGLARRENPRWPAITGLALSLLPAAGGVYLLCGAPW